MRTARYDKQRNNIITEVVLHALKPGWNPLSLEAFIAISKKHRKLSELRIMAQLILAQLQVKWSGVGGWELIRLLQSSCCIRK